MRIRNLSTKGIILTLGTDRLHFEPARAGYCAMGTQKSRPPTRRTQTAF